MRNTLRYPVTLAEVASELEQIVQELIPGPDGPVGSMRPVLVKMAANLLRDMQRLLANAPVARPIVPNLPNSVQLGAYSTDAAKYDMVEMVRRNFE